MRTASPIQLIVFLLLTSFSNLHAADTTRKLNVLFIAADDLRPQLNCYGHSEMITPNIDALAARGMVFERAYCQAAVCRASRASLLTGLRPDSTEIWSNGSRHKHFRDHLTDVVTLPEQFKNHGYRSQAFGKLYHGAFAVRNKWNDPKSWSDPAWLNEPRYYYSEEGVRVARGVFARKTKAKGDKIDDWVNHFVLGLSHEAPDVDDDVLQDGQIALQGIAALRKLKDESFFLALGFLKPHLPFIAPKKYWDMYPPEKVRVATNRKAPKDAPKFASTNWGHPRTYTDFPGKGEPSDELVLELTRGYAACVTYVDAQVGRVLDELDRLGLRDSTIVVLWGDHGWHLGENHIWGKATNFELSAHAPLIVSDPRMKAAGRKTPALVEFVDIYPTLCELADLPLPDFLEGTSFAPLLDKPTQEWKSAAFSQYPNQSHMGRSIRTDRYRFTRWTKAGKPEMVGGLELYDHKTDPQENVNIANLPENAELVKKLTEKLSSGWRAALPPKSE
ncbi:MAG: sulfatase [Verrucomicrobiota bacterium]